MYKLKKLYRKVRDPRAANARHELLEILVIALAAVLSGAEGASDIARFGLAKANLFRQFLRLEHGIPSHDTFSRVFRMLDPKAFEQAFRQFVAAFARFNRIDLSGVIAIDGKSLRRAYERGESTTPMHLVSAFASEARMALASRKAPGRNELDAALEVLKILSLKRSIVTGDALFCSRPFARTVLEEDGDYVLALKKNQSKLFAAVESRFTQAGPRSTAEKVELSTHDRKERRRATVIRDKALAIAQKFPGIVALGRITSRRQPHGAKAGKPTTRYFLLSTYLSTTRLLKVVRSHWSIENQLHWMLDVVLREDQDRARKDNAPENFSILRKFALNTLRAHPAKMSIRQKIKTAGWDDNFLLSLLTHMQ